MDFLVLKISSEKVYFRSEIRESDITFISFEWFKIDKCPPHYKYIILSQVFATNLTK